MPINNLSTSKDITISFKNSIGKTLILNKIMEFEAMPDTQQRMVAVISGNIIPQVIPAGYKGTFTNYRTDAQIEVFWADYEAAYYQGVNLQGSSMIVTTIEVGGNTTQYKFFDVFFDVKTFGRLAAPAENIEQKFEFLASKRETLL